MRIFKNKETVDNNDLFLNEKLPSKLKLIRKINTLINEKEYLENIIKDSLYDKFFDTINLEDKCKSYKKQIKNYKKKLAAVKSK